MPSLLIQKTVAKDIMTHTRHLYVSSLILLWLVSAYTAIAQSEKTPNQNLQSESQTLVPPNWVSPAENTRAPQDKWVPPDINTYQPSVAPNVSCSLPDVISRVGTKVQNLVHNLDRFSATEVIEHENVARSGNLRPSEIHKFNYVFSLRESSNGYMDAEEYRSRAMSENQFPGEITTANVPSIVLVFHPNYVSNFRMSCEGLGNWNGQSAWQIRFEERSDSVHHLSVIIIDRKIYNVKFRGRAWILENSHQLVHMELDLVEPIPKIRLRLYHEVLEYRPVSLPKSDTEFWLPSSAELYVDFKGHRFYRRHSYVDFKLFTVEVHQQMGGLR